jgi:hypothetical protein
MTVQYILAGTPEAGRGLEGFPDTDIIRISYNFPNGIQVCFLPLCFDMFLCNSIHESGCEAFA